MEEARQKAGELRRQSGEVVDGARQKAGELLQEARGKAGELGQQAGELLDKARGKSDDEKKKKAICPGGADTLFKGLARLPFFEKSEKPFLPWQEGLFC